MERAFSVPEVRKELEEIERRRTPDLEKVFASVKEIIEKSELEEKEKEKLLGLLGDAERAAFRYIEAFCETVAVSLRKETLGVRDPNRYMDLVHQSDQNRRIAHNAYIDSLNILFRNALKRGLDVEEYAKELAGHQDDSRHRYRVGDAALSYVWNELRKEAELDA